MAALSEEGNPPAAAVQRPGHPRQHVLGAGEGGGVPRRASMAAERPRDWEQGSLSQTYEGMGRGGRGEGKGGGGGGGGERWVAMDRLVLAALPCGPQGARRRIQAGLMVWRNLRSS